MIKYNVNMGEGVVRGGKNDMKGTVRDGLND